MEQEVPSDYSSVALPVHTVSTADLVAAARALHRERANPIADDPFAHRLCGRLLGLALVFPPLKWLLFDVYLRPLHPVTMCVVMRARFAEEALEQSVADGVRQYVIIGAGMDSFAFRKPDILERISVFEIDHPVTQRKKLQRIARAGLEVSTNHHFVPADLSQTSPLTALASSPFDRSLPSFCSLLGVAYYLTPATLESTARSLADGMAPGTRLVLDYLLDTASSRQRDRQVRRRLMDFVDKRGEPMRADYSLDGIGSLMAAGGLDVVENVAMSDLAEVYRREVGPLAFEIPGIFGVGHFEVSGLRR